MITGFVFTNYNNSHLTKSLIKSITENSQIDDYEIVIVDNNSDNNQKKTLLKLENVSNKIKLILNPENVGYFRGLNIGINYLRKRENPIGTIIIGNNDLIFPPDFFFRFNNIKSLLNIFPVISPNIITIDGVNQNPHAIQRVGIFREIIYDLYYSNYFIAKLIMSFANNTKHITGRTDHKQHLIPQTIFQGYGACYILSPLFFENFENLWAPTFLMGEEFFLSKQISFINKKIFYEPSIIVYHHEHASVNKMPKKEFWKISKNAHKEYRKHVKITDFIGL